MTPTALIVTLQLDAASAARFTAVRQAHFPAKRNWLAAHITLFHALPVTSLDTVLADAADAARMTKAFRMRVDRVLFLGGGVAFAIASPEGLGLRRTLAQRWEPLLGRQDRAWQGRLHITVQNKVAPATARALHARLEQDFVPEEICATGFDIWYYMGGPWQAAETFSFATSCNTPLCHSSSAVATKASVDPAAFGDAESVSPMRIAATSSRHIRSAALCHCGGVLAQCGGKEVDERLDP